jgi:hypothetical protein
VRHDSDISNHGYGRLVGHLVFGLPFLAIPEDYQR